MNIENGFVEAVIKANKDFGTCQECSHGNTNCEGLVRYDTTITKKYENGHEEEREYYYCEKCNKEYVKCPSCGEIVEEDDLTDYYGDTICFICGDNGYGE